MSTVAPHPPAPPPGPAPHAHPALVDSEGYIDEHIRRTRRSLKLVDLAAGVITLVMGLLAFLLVAGLIDHWVIPGGLGTAGRMTLFGILLLGVCWYGWKQFVPLLRSINPVYAAHTIEQTSPSLKNSLLNVLLFRNHRQDMSARVYHALQQQAAQRLSAAPADATIDRAALLRLGYALVAVIAACALYSVLSPKNLAVSAARIFVPWSNIAAPSRVHITDVKPGDSSVAIGERVNISAEILGAAEDDPVRLRYTTLDESLVDEAIVMTRPAGAVRYSADLPRATDASHNLGHGDLGGVQQPLEYWIEAGDARSRRFRLDVFQRPTIVVQRVRYQYPDYTHEPPVTVDHVGDVRGIEGTIVTVEALASEPIKNANVDFDADGSSDKRMTVDGDRATVSFTLELREDRRTPWHLTYALRFTTNEGRTNDDPVQHRLDVTPDYAPEVTITRPEEPELSVRAGDTVLIGLEARDPDYALTSVRFLGRVENRELQLSDRLTGGPREGLYRDMMPFVPADAGLQPGEVLEYWAEARDNRSPEPNIGLSEHRRLKIVANDTPGDPQQNNQNQGGAQQPGGDNGAGDQGENGADGAPGGQAGEGENGAEGDSGKGTPQGGQGAPGGAGDSGEAQSSDAQGGTSQPGGEGGDSSEDQSAQAGSGSGASSGDNRQPGENQTPSGDPQQGASSENQETAANESSNGGTQGADGAPGGDAQGADSQPVSSAGDDDATAMDRIRQQMQQEDAAGGNADQANGESSEGNQAQGQGASDAQGQNADGAEGDSETNPGGASQQSDGGAESGESTDNVSGSEQSPNQPGESADSGATDTSAGADGANNPSNGGAPAGDHPEQSGAPEAGNKQQRDQAGGDESESGADSEAATAESQGQTESNTRGEQNGDRAGEGAPGAGQQAENAGRGEAGSHEASDTGANQSSEPGAGETGTQAGNEQTADGKTGESSNDQQGNGSESRGADEGAPDSPSAGEPASAGGQPNENTAQQDPAAGDQSTDQGAAQSGPPGDQSQGQDADPAAGQQPGQAGQSGSPNGEPASADGFPAPQTGAQTAPTQASTGNESPQPSQNPADQNPNQSPPQGGSATSPPTGGTSGGGVNGDGQMIEPGGDDPNLAYAREQADLVINRLDEQLAKHKVDPKLLKSLGWSEEDLRAFVDRWKSLKAAADAPGDAAADARDELNAALRSLGLRPTGPLQVKGAATPDELRDLNEAYRGRAPVEYADRVRAYVRGAAEEE